MLTRITAALTACLLLLTINAHADDSRGYIGFSFGAAKTKDIHNQMADLAQDLVNINPALSPITVESDDGGAAFKLYYGMAINNNLDVQVSYVNFGKIESALKTSSPTVGTITASVALQGITLAAAPKLPLSSTVDLIGKAGISYFASKQEVKTAAINFSESDNGTAFFLGAGVAANFDKISLTLEFERHQRVMEDTNFNLTTLGLRYHF